MSLESLQSKLVWRKWTQKTLSNIEQKSNRPLAIRSIYTEINPRPFDKDKSFIVAWICFRKKNLNCDYSVLRTYPFQKTASDVKESVFTRLKFLQEIPNNKEALAVTLGSNFGWIVSRTLTRHKWLMLHVVLPFSSCVTLTGIRHAERK